MSVKDELKTYIDTMDKTKSGDEYQRPNVRVPKAFLLSVITSLPVGMFEHPDLKQLKAYHKSSPGTDDAVVPRAFLEGVHSRL